MSFSLPPAVQDIPFADAYLEALGKHHHVPLLGYAKRLENWLQHVCLQQAADAPVDTSRAVGFDFELPDNLPLAIQINAMRNEAALVALWRQQGLGSAAPVATLLPLVVAAWWRTVIAPAETATDTPWQQLLYTLAIVRRHAHSLDSLRLLLTAVFQLNEALQNYDQQALQLTLPPYPQWQRLLRTVQQQKTAEEMMPDGSVVPAREGLLPTWLQGDWQTLLTDYGLLPNLPHVDAEAVKKQHQFMPLKPCFETLVDLHHRSVGEAMPPLCLLGARLAMEWRMQAMKFDNKGSE